MGTIGVTKMVQTNLFHFLFLFLAMSFNQPKFTVDEFTAEVCPSCMGGMHKDNNYCCLDCYLRDHPEESIKSIVKSIPNIVKRL